MMMRKAEGAIWVLATFVLAGLFAATLATPQKDDRAEVMLQAALHKQLVEGDLEGAIEQYKSIVGNFSADHAVAAKALVEMGGCYEKLGKEEARKAYERVLRDYGDQSEAATKARTRLAALSGNGASKGSEMLARRVWVGPDVDTSGAVSPDGRFLTYVDWETGDLAIRDLHNGEKHRLTNKGTWSVSHEFALSSVPSPDGKQVAYDWLNKDFRRDLRVVGLDGSAPRILHSNKEVEELDPVDWSPDGKYILARLLSRDRGFQIVLVSAADGSVRVLKMLDWSFPGKMCFSPDGRYIAYDFPPEQDSPNRDISLLSFDGTEQVPLVQHPANDILLGWTPDGTSIFFASDRTGSMGVWTVRVANGRAQGAPELIKADAGQIAALGLTRKGAFYYGVQIGREDVYLATLDEKTGRLLTAPSAVTQLYSGSNSSPYWSPDGQYLAYTSQRGHSQVGLGPKAIVIRSIKTGEERELDPKLNYFELGPWSPDGRSLLSTGTDIKGRAGIFRIDTQSAGVTSVVLNEPGTDFYQPMWSANGKTIFFRRGDAAKSSSLVARDLESGLEQELYHAALPSSFVDYNVGLSTDGGQLAFFLLQSRNQPKLLMVISTSGGEPRKLLELRESEGAGSIAWTPDSRYIVFSKGRALPQKPNDELWRIPAEGGVPERLGLATASLRDVRFHPDGRQIAFTAGQDRSEIWVMENFLPVEKASR